MAEIFQPILTPTPTGGLPAAPVRPGLPVAEALVKVGVTGLEVAQKASDIGEVNEFKKALGDITKAKVRTDEQIAGITAELEGADRATVARLGRRLSLLATGQEQGSLTTTQATARASVEFRKAAAANPRITEELRQVLRFSTFGGSAGGTGGSESNPLIKAAIQREAMVADIMFKGNVTRKTAESFLQSQQEFEQIKLSNDIAMQKGVAGFNSVIGAASASAQQVQYSFLGDMNVTLAEAPGAFDPNIFKASVTQTFLSLERDWSKRLANSNIQFTAVQRKEITAVFRDTRDMMIAISDSKDPKLHMERINEILDGEEKMVASRFLKNMGAQFRLMAELGSPEQVFNTLFNTIPKALGQLDRDRGKFNALVQAAEDSGDADMIFALQYAQGNPTVTVRQWRDQLNGSISGTVAQVELNRNISGKVINTASQRGNVDSKEASNVFDYLAKNADDVTNSEIPSNVSALYQPGFANRMSQDAKLAQHVRTRVAGRMALKARLIKKRLAPPAIGVEKDVPPFKLFVDEGALANPIVTKTGLFTRGIKAADIFKIGVEGMTDEDIANAPKITAAAGPTSARAILDVTLMDEYVATLVASGMPPSAVRREIDVVLKIVNGEDIDKVQTVGETLKDPFSFLRGATESELSTLLDNVSDKDLLAALKREKGRRDK